MGCGVVTVAVAIGSSRVGIGSGELVAARAADTSPAPRRATPTAQHRGGLRYPPGRRWSTRPSLDRDPRSTQPKETPCPSSTAARRPWPSIAAKRYSAVIETTAGTLTADLFASEVPNTVNNFVFLAREGFYDGVIFHRVIEGFMIQGGDPTGTGRGGPGYKFADEQVTRPYTRGTLAMANAGPNTNGSQFFVMHADYRLPPNYTIFGKLTAGEDVIDAIATARTGSQDRPVEPVSITSVTITEA